MSSDESHVLALVPTMRTALAAATTLEDLTWIRSQAEAIRCLAQNANLGLTMVNQWAEFKLRAERQAGEMLSALSLSGGDRKSKSHESTLKLRDLGISKDQSSRWQREASVPELEFEAFLQEAQRDGREVTSADLLRHVHARTGRRASRLRTVNARREGDCYVVGESLPLDRSAKTCANFTAVCADRDLLAEAVNHLDIVISHLLPFCEHNLHVMPAARRHSAKLLVELRSLLMDLARVQ